MAGPDGTFGNRFDDPEGAYRVLYASSQRLGCFLETLARFRVDIKLYAELTEIAGDNDYFPLGRCWPNGPNVAQLARLLTTVSMRTSMGVNGLAD